MNKFFKKIKLRYKIWCVKCEIREVDTQYEQMAMGGLFSPQMYLNEMNSLKRKIAKLKTKLDSL